MVCSKVPDTMESLVKKNDWKIPNGLVVGNTSSRIVQYSAFLIAMFKKKTRNWRRLSSRNL